MSEDWHADSAIEMDAEAFYREHFNYSDVREPSLRERGIRGLAQRCPIAHSDAQGGFFVVNAYDLAKDGLADWETFSSRAEKSITPQVKGKTHRGPIDVDPPLQRALRKILNPYLTPKRLAPLEPSIRELCCELIDGFINAGHCDLAEQFARPFPGRMLYKFLLGADDADVPRVKAWSETVIFDVDHPENRAAAMVNIRGWIRDLVDERRPAPRRDDIVDAIIHADVDGRPIDDEAIMGCILILIEGGFSTTSDSITSAMLRLAERPELQHRLRHDPAAIPTSLDEFLRYDPPIPGIPRIATSDTTIGEVQVRAGERVYINFHAANRDPTEFSDPELLDIDRIPNRHLSFGLGVHRCVGSNVARLNMRIALEELLSRLSEFHLTPGEPVRRLPGPTWGPRSLPLTFTAAAQVERT
jgi:cytochrome P450